MRLRDIYRFPSFGRTWTRTREEIGNAGVSAFKSGYGCEVSGAGVVEDGDGHYHAAFEGWWGWDGVCPGLGGEVEYIYLLVC